MKKGARVPVIAIVDDSRTIRRVLAVMLEDLYETVEYQSGNAALAGMTAAVPDLVLLDIELPEMDGTVVLQHIREHPNLARVPVIALTGFSASNDEERYLSMGFDSYIAKPIVDESKLFDEIARLLH